MRNGLYLDDDIDKLNFLREILEDVSNLNTFTDPRLALSSLERIDYDFIVVDISMPIMNGLDFIEIIKKNGLIKNEKIFILSTHQDEDTKIRGLSLGLSDYLSFEMTPKEIMLRISNHFKDNVTDNKFDGIEFDNYKSTITFNFKTISLTPLEYRIVTAVSANNGRIDSFDEIVDIIWTESVVSRKTVNTHLSNLNKKISEISLKIKRTDESGILLIF